MVVKTQNKYGVAQRDTDIDNLFLYIVQSSC